jgi:hypothetical protein
MVDSRILLPGLQGDTDFKQMTALFGDLKGDH